MSWWLTDVARAKAERTAIAQLSERDGWLSGISWRLGDDLHLIVDFDVQHGAETFGLSMIYPSTFPDTPPMVQPRDERRLSWHQYGPGGELCLEFRPDNWAPSITGAMMVESAHRLLSGERPGENEPGIVRSAHQASIGRETRGEFTRFILDDSAATVLAALPVDVPTAITVWDRLAKPTWVASLMSVGEEGILWAQNAPQPSHSSVANGFVIRTTRNVDRFRLSPKDFADVMPVEFPDLLAKLPKNPFDGFVLLGDENHWVALNLYPYEGKQSVFGYKIIVAPSVSGRLPAGYDSLAQKRIAIVGCGSVGSKIAGTLARSGVRNFTLVDDDVFFQANLVRNDLDAQAIGQHKVDALGARLQNLVANADISVRRIALGQQESAGSTESVMEELVQADLLVDATADPRAFNLVAAVARRHSKPMVWCQVFAGGIGGIIARVRPGFDPIPTEARSQIRAWCDSHNVPWIAATETDYGIERDNAQPLIADDADVSVIANHASRFILDFLTREQSVFPCSAYAIGLVAEWIFHAPFDTWPIDLRQEGDWGGAQELASSEELKELLTSLFPKVNA